MDRISLEYFGKGERLDRFLSKNFVKLSRTQLQKRIQSGEVSVNGKPVEKKNYLLHNADQVAFLYEEARLRKSPKIKLRKIYEDADILVVDKPAGVPVHPTPTRNKDSVAGAVLAAGLDLRGVGENSFRPGIVHRLDADTSGLLVIAKSPIAYDFVKKAFQSRKVVKEYLALVHGQPPSSHGLVDKPVGRRTGQGKFQTGIGRPALTEYWVQDRYRDGVDPVQSQTLAASAGVKQHPTSNGVDNYALVRIQLHTGRTHQIRVHFSSLGHPIAGDRLYGGKFRKSDEKIFPRQFLHAYYLKIPSPSGGTKEFQIELPPDLKRALDQLTKL